MAQAQLLYVGTRAGITILSNPGRTDRWITVGVELPDHAIGALACAPDAPMQVTAWTATSVFGSIDGGQEWSELTAVQAPSLPATSFVFSGAIPAALRITSEGSLERSADHGTTWERVELESAGSWTVIAGPAYHFDMAYLGSANGEVWFSHDRGRTWSRVKRDLPPVTALAIGRVIS